jgi:predicted RNA-binding Zn ribbon-like protein
MTGANRAPRPPARLGGLLCLDFVNTVDPRHDSDRREYLPDYRALVRWAEDVGLADQVTGRRLRTLAAEQPARARAVQRRALAFREALYEVFSAARRGAAPPPGALGTLDELLAEAAAMARLTPGPERFVWTFQPSDRLDQVLWPVARSAAELLTSDRLGRVRECPGDDGCGWLFLDTSKSGTRQWCSMRSCGNRAKVRRYSARHRTPAD